MFSGGRYPRLDTRRLRCESPAQELRKPFDHIAAVQILAAGFLRHDLEYTVLVNACCKLACYLPLLLLGQRRRCANVESKRHLAAHLIHVLSAGPAAAGGA